MKKNLFFKSLLAVGLLSALQARANFTYEGTLVDPTGNPVTSNMVQFVLEVMSPGTEACVLYKEYQTIDMTTSGGYFSLNVGAGTVMGTYPALARVFQNHGTMSGLTCNSGTSYAPGFADIRKMRVSVSINGGTTDVLGSLVINTVPMAENSRSVGAFEAGNLLRAVDGSSNPAPIAAFNPTQMTELLNLIAGTSTLYAPSGSGGATGAAGGDLMGTYPNPSLANSGVTAGTYGSAIMVPTVTVDPKGRVTAITNTSIMGLLPGAGTPGSYLRSNGSTWMSQNILLNEIKNGASMNPFITTPCAPNQAMNWSTVMDAFECSLIGGLDATTLVSGLINPYRLGNGSPNSGSFLRGDGQWMPFNEMDPKIGGMTMNTVPRWNGSQLTGGSINDMGGGMVGINTASPNATLAVNGAIQINDDFMGCGAGRQGTIRFSSGALQFCDGTSWLTFAGAGGGSPEQTGSYPTADFSMAETIVFPSAPSGSITLNGLQPGKKNKLIILNTAAVMYTFTGCSGSYFSPPNQTMTASSKVTFEIYKVNYNGSCLIEWKAFQ